MECEHLNLTKVVNNEDPNTYQCDQCQDLIHVTLAPVALPKPVFPKAAEEMHAWHRITWNCGRQ
jgi:hypothetical protein